MEKIWKEIENYPDYLISNYGEVFSKKRNLTLKYRKNDRGYFSIVLYNKGEFKSFRVHRLVLSIFDNKDYSSYKLECNHIDEDKNNNRLDNLNWLSRKENMNWRNLSSRIKRNPTQKTEVFIQRIKEINSKKIVGINIITGENIFFDSMADAKRIGYNAGNISACCRGERKKHKGYKWKFV